MDNKITIIGYTGSGKTTYLIGMYMCMSGAGCKNYTIGTRDPNQDVNLEKLWERLCDGKFPDASYNSEKYTFHIAHNYKPVCDFDWLDYPGGILSEPDHKDSAALKKSISSSDCLLLVLDGEKFKIDAQDEREYGEKLAKKIHWDKGMRNELKEFTTLAQDGIKIPPICIVITKCDLLELDIDYCKVIERVLKETMSPLFEGTDVIITAVSLGSDIEEEGPEPHCIEEPIAFAVLTILMKYMKELSEKKSQNRQVLNKERNFLTRWLYSEEVKEAGSKLQNLDEVGNKWMIDAFELLELFDSDKDIFIKGIKRNLREYMRDEFSKINA